MKTEFAAPAKTMTITLETEAEIQMMHYVVGQHISLKAINEIVGEKKQQEVFHSYIDLFNALSRESQA